MTRLAVITVALCAFVTLLVPAQADAARAKTWNTRLVGHLDPRGGFNADIWVHRRTAYLGSWGASGACPTFGVRAISVRRPARPRIVSRFARFRGTSSEDVWVGAVDTPVFRGDLAAVGLQRCRAGGFAGLALYDVTQPGRPRLLSQIASGPGTRGVHEMSVVQRPDGRVLALLAVPQSLYTSGDRKGDVRIVDVTDPRNPLEIADWDYRRDGPAGERERLTAVRGASELLVHSAWPFAGGMRAFISHWDAGAVFLDLADPAAPRYLGRTAFPGRANGNAHSGWFMPSERYFVQNDEVGDFYNVGIERGAWGFQRVFDVSDPARPRQVARVATENSIRGRDGRLPMDGFYSVHNNVFIGNVEVASWYSDGVRIFNLRNPRRPRQIGYFVPPPKADPQRLWVAPNGKRAFANVWGVYPYGGLVYASDIHSGLWVIRARGIPWGAAGTPRP